MLLIQGQDVEEDSKQIYAELKISKWMEIDTETGTRLKEME